MPRRPLKELAMPMQMVNDRYYAGIGQPELHAELRDITQPETLLSEDARFNGQPIHDIGHGREAVIGLAQLRQPKPQYAMGPIQGLRDLPSKQDMAAKQRDNERRQKDWASIVSKATRGYGQPGESLIPLSALPAGARGLFGTDGGPAVGVDPSKLTPSERLLMAQLQMMGKKEAEKAHDEAMKELAAQRGGVRQ